MKPEEIEDLSFKIIEDEAGPHEFSADQWQIVRRMIHTSADFEYLQSVRFHPRAIEAGKKAIRAGKPIVTDTRMAMAGISQNRLAPFKVALHCLIGDSRVVDMAAQTGITRARAAVDVAAEAFEGGIYVIGNAPTALLRLIELVRQNSVLPDLIVGLPVGFVNAAESKQALLDLDTPFITNAGRKGGSNLAASVVNALAILASR